MYNIVKDNVIHPTSSGNNRCPTGYTGQTGGLDTNQLGQLTSYKSLRGIVNIAKIRRQYSWDVCGWCSDKKKRFSLTSVDTFKEKTNQHRTFYPQRAGKWSIQMEFLSVV